MSEQVEDLPTLLASRLREDKSFALKKDVFRRIVDAYIDEPDVWIQIRELLKTYRLLREVEPRVKAAAQKIQNIRQIAAPQTSEKSVNEIWREAPVGNDVYAPSSYVVLEDQQLAIARLERKMVGDQLVERRVPVSLSPILISRRIGQIQSNEVLWEIAWRSASNKWRQKTFERDVMLSSRKILDTASHGLPVSSGNALEVTDWLRHFEHTNADYLPLGYATHSLGWQGPEDNPTKHGFMCGTRQVGGNGRAIEVEGSVGDMQGAKEIRTHGALQEWYDAIAAVSGYSAVRLGIYAALAGPCIAIVGAPNAIVEWAGRTSTGKTTVLQIAQSCWRSGGKELDTWNTTILNVEEAAKFSCDLPLFIDDTAAAVEGGRSKSIGTVIYQLVSGRARGRSQLQGGQRARPSWRTMVLATGEKPIGELAKAEGAAARVLTFWSSPFGDVTEAKRELMGDVLRRLSQNYGHAGPALVQWLCDNRDKWDMAHKIFDEAASKVIKMIHTPAAARLSSVVGLLEVTAWCAHQAVDLPWEPRSILDDPEILHALRNALSLASSTADRAYEAWEHAHSIAHARSRAWLPFGEDAGKDDKEPVTGWLGWRHYKAQESDPNDDDFFAWHPPLLKKVLLDGGYDAGAVLRAWRDIGVLSQPERGRFTSQMRPIDGSRTKLRLVCVKMAYPGHEMDDDDDDG